MRLFRANGCLTPSGAGTTRQGRAPWTPASPNFAAVSATIHRTPAISKPCPERVTALSVSWRPRLEMALAAQPRAVGRDAGDRRIPCGTSRPAPSRLFALRHRHLVDPPGRDGLLVRGARSGDREADQARATPVCPRGSEQGGGRPEKV